jgi:two-component system, chemotaxis family, sensor kinase CheA
VEPADYLDLFIAEAREHIEGAAALLTRARETALSREEINDLFRHAHSIKGMSAALGLAPMTSLSHLMEDLLHRWRDHATAPTPEALEVLTRANDHLSSQVDAVVAGQELPIASTIESQIRALSPAPPEPGIPSGTTPPVEKEIDPYRAEDGRPRLLVDVAIRKDAPLPGARAMVILKRLQEHGRVTDISPAPQILTTGGFNGRLRVVLSSNLLPDRLASIVLGLPDVSSCQVTPAAATSSPDTRPAKEAPEPGSLRTTQDRLAPAETITTIRVATDRMDHLLDGIGELILDHERLKRTLPPEPGAATAEILATIGRTIDRLRHEVMTMRLLPFSSVVPRLERSVRELATRLGKEIELQVSGSEVSLDRATLEEMIDPLQHILRNSIDHGLETPAERRAAGKPARGRIQIDLSQRDERIGLTISDDGRGIDPAALRKVAVERRFLSREQASRLSDDEALMLVTIPGFSTAARTTDISGRGVGMDVVRMRVQKLGGRLVIRSQAGCGTRLEMDLPPTVTVSRAFLCRAGGEVFAVPVSAVQSTLEVRRDRLQSSQGERVLRRGEDLVTLLPLGGVLSGNRAAPFPEAFPAFVYRVGARTYALGVDEILGEEAIVVKPLRHPLELLPHYAGAAILNDGQIALIVDPFTLTRATRHE